MEFYALKSNESGLYLRHIPEPIENLHGILRFSRADQNGEDARFLMERSNTNPEYVHIKCSSNCKYLNKAPENGTPLILAAAELPVEDTNQPTCTLFKLEPSGKEYHDNDKVRLVHVQSRLYVRPITEGKFESCLGVVTEGEGEVVIPVDEVVTPSIVASLPSPTRDSLPSPFVLKANTNNKYLRYHDSENGILRFSEDDPKSRCAKFIVETPNNEDYVSMDCVHIKCAYTDKYLRRDQNEPLILAAATDRNENKNNWACTLFKVKSVGPLDSNNQITRCRFIHLQSGLYSRLLVDRNSEFGLEDKNHDPHELDVYTLSSVPLSS